jgi:hypothetical protein
VRPVAGGSVTAFRAIVLRAKAENSAAMARCLLASAEADTNPFPE